jgi:hypothetical protein
VTRWTRDESRAPPGAARWHLSARVPFRRGLELWNFFLLTNSCGTHSTSQNCRHRIFEYLRAHSDTPSGQAGWYGVAEQVRGVECEGHSPNTDAVVPRRRRRHGLSTLALEFDGGRLDRRADVGLPSLATLKQTAPATASASPRASARGLDWFTFFLADIQTGFGPFVAIYWDQCPKVGPSFVPIAERCIP